MENNNEKSDDVSILPVFQECTGLTQKTMEKAKIELGESESVQQDGLNALRKLLEENCQDYENCDHFKRLRESSDRFLIRFLRCRKYDTEKTWKLIKRYINYHQKFPEIVETLEDDELRRRMQKAEPGFLSKRDSEGRVILLFKISEWDPTDYPFWKVVQTYVHLFEMFLESEETQVNGIVILYNFEGYTFSQMAATKLSDYTKLAELFQGSFPIRVKGIHIIRSSRIFASIFNIIKKLIGGKLLGRVHMYGPSDDKQSLFDTIAKENIPEDFDGTASPYDGRSMAEMIIQRKNKIKSSN